jgi:iron complex outermembrane receptor protein
MRVENMVSKLLATSVLLVVTGAPTIAQEATRSNADGDQTGEPASLQEVVVTAEKREERAIDVPISLAVLNASNITDDSARTLIDIAQSVPDVTFGGSQNTKLNSVSIRGVGSSSRNIGFDTRVGVYLDGVYIGQSANIDQQLLNIERVEVLRGPQGTLFGKNTDAGAINIVTSEPTRNFGATVDANIGNYDSRVYSGTLNLPTSGSTALRVGVINSKREGYFYNVFNGQRIADENRTQAIAQFLAKPSDRLKIRLSADYYSAPHETWLQPIPITDTFGQTTPAYDARFYNVDFNYVPTLDTRRGGVAADISYQYGDGVTGRSISAYRYTYQAGHNDSDYSALDAVGADEGDWYKQITQEFQLLSATGRRFEWLAGFYSYHQDAFTNRNVVVGTYGPVVGLLTDPHSLTQRGVVTTQSYSLYGNTSYHATDALSATVGLRLGTESKSTNWNQQGSLAAEAGLAQGVYTDSVRYNSYTPDFSLTYKIKDSAVTFLRVARGEKSGGFNLDYISADLFPDHLRYKPESSTDFELGIKGEMDRASYSLTGFVTNYTDLQANQLRLLSPGHPGYVIGNVGARTKGVEFEGAYRFTPGVSINGGFSVISAICSACAGAGDHGTDATGLRLPGVSRSQAFVSLVLQHSLLRTPLQWRANLNYSYIGPSFSSFSNAYTTTLPSGQTIPYNHVGGRSLADARVSLFPDRDNWEVAFWGRNLFDRQYVYGYGSDLFGTLISDRGLPRTFGVEAQVHF